MSLSARRTQSHTPEKSKTEHQSSTKKVPFFGKKSSFFQNPQNIQRKCAECEEEEEAAQRQPGEEEEEELQMKENSSTISQKGGSTENLSGLPNQLRSGLETLSGMELSGVNVHRNSAKPSRINALAYTKGSDIYVGPGQEKYIPHEGWHVVQQKQGRVKPTRMLNGESINDDQRLEKEADRMGEKAINISGKHATFDSDSSKTAQLKQSSSVVQRVAPVVFAGLTLPELATVVGSVTAVASAVGSVAAAHNEETGKGPVMKLEFDGDYLLMPSGKAELENISRVLFLMEMERLYERFSPDEEPDDDQKQEIRQTAIGNVRQVVSNTLDEQATLKRGEFVANGDGGRTRITPWGAIKMRVDGGWALTSNFRDGLLTEAENRGINLTGMQIDILKSCIVDYEYERDVDLFSDDDIYVRGQDLNYYDDDGLIMIDCTVAFDWDGDTTYLEWKDGLSIRVGYDINRPAWVGPSDPDD